MEMFKNFIFKNGKIEDTNWIKWYHWEVPDEEGPMRETIRNKLAVLGHCLKCTSLSGCFFVKSRLPENILPRKLFTKSVIV